MHKIISLFLVSFIVLMSSATPSHAQRRRANEFVDLSLLVDTNYPCTWPTGFPMFQIRPFKAIGPASIYNIDVLQIDGNTGTLIDVPPHSIPRPGTNLQWEGELGLRARLDLCGGRGEVERVGAAKGRPRLGKLADVDHRFS